MTDNRPGEAAVGEPPFAVGDIVETIKGAKFWGEIVSCYPLPALPGYEDVVQWRSDVRAVAPDFLGTIHVYPAAQLRRRSPPRGTGEAVADEPYVPVIIRNDSAGFYEFVTEDVPALYSGMMAANVERIVTMSGDLIGFRIYDPAPAGRTVPDGEWPTEAMIRAGMDRLGWWTEPRPTEFEGSGIIQDGLTQEEADDINRQLRAELLEVFGAMLAAAPLAPTTGTDRASVLEEAKAAIERLRPGKWSAMDSHGNYVRDQTLLRALSAIRALAPTPASSPITGDGEE